MAEVRRGSPCRRVEVVRWGGATDVRAIHGPPTAMSHRLLPRASASSAPSEDRRGRRRFHLEDRRGPEKASGSKLRTQGGRATANLASGWAWSSRGVRSAATPTAPHVALVQGSRGSALHARLPASHRRQRAQSPGHASSSRPARGPGPGPTTISHAALAQEDFEPLPTHMEATRDQPASLGTAADSSSTPPRPCRRPR